MENGIQTVEKAAAIQVLPEQLVLIRNTVAKDATPEELELYFYDCKRRGVHPLDKLIHFTKRNGRYTPVTSIDYMRQRAAATNQCAGIDDPTFTGTVMGPDFAAKVVVRRMVSGIPCEFSATARWAEYKPEAGTSGRGDIMWRKMPHCMLGKCAEALALRKAFPHELQGLYEHSEMDQAGPVDVAPKPRVQAVIQPKPAQSLPFPDQHLRKAAQIADQLVAVATEAERVLPAEEASPFDRLVDEVAAADIAKKAKAPTPLQVADGIQEVETFVNDVRQVAQGKTAKGPWTLWVIDTDEGEFQTFSRSTAERLGASVGSSCTINWKPGRKPGSRAVVDD